LWRFEGGNMSNRGKGGKDLGKGGAKRHKKVLHDTIHGTMKPTVRCLSGRGSVKQSTALYMKK